MKVLVTGGLGFLGKHVQRELANSGHEVLLFDRCKYFSNEKPLGGREVFLGDVRDRSSVYDAVGRVDGVVHLAGILGTQECVKNPYPAIDTNIMGGIHVLEAVSELDVPAVFNGVGNHFMDNTYSITKSTIERFVQMYNRDRGARVNIVRLVNAYGPGQSASAPYGSSKVRKVVPSFACRAIKGDPIEIYGEGKQCADMIYVEDVAKATVAALEKAADGVVIRRAAEVGPKDHISVLGLAEKIKELAGSDSDIRHLPMRPGEIVSDVTADWKTLGLVGMNVDELMPLDVGLTIAIDYYRDMLDA